MKNQGELLKKALATKMKIRTRNISIQDIELALAWMRDEVTGVQAAAALGLGSSSVQMWFGIRLREAYRRGMLAEKATRGKP